MFEDFARCIRDPYPFVDADVLGTDGPDRPVAFVGHAEDADARERDGAACDDNGLVVIETGRWSCDRGW